MKRIVFSLVFVLSSWTSPFAQSIPVDNISSVVTDNVVEAHIRFLASDFFRGRDTGSPEIDLAADYLANQFRAFGLKTVDGAPDFLQPVFLAKSLPATAYSILVEGSILATEEIALLSPVDFAVDAPLLYVGYGQDSDIDAKKAAGKILVALAGREEGDNIQGIVGEFTAKRARAKAAGAAGLIELYTLPTLPFERVKSWTSGSRLDVKMSDEQKAEVLPHFLVKKSENIAWDKFKGRKKQVASLVADGNSEEVIPGKNVIGMVEGTDPELKKQYIIMSAHYDHVGVTKREGVEDSIYNGARDNALGTASLLASAQYYAKNPAKRSIVFLAVTAEEKGLLGSKFYAQNPLLPLSETMFALNTDGAGFMDTTFTTTIGFEYVNALETVEKAGEPYGLKAYGDSLPEQNLFYRSDHYNFAQAGVPSITVAPATLSFNEKITKYYHQPADEADSIDFHYVGRYARKLASTLHLISNGDNLPYWKPGNEFYPKGQALYGKE